MEIINLKNLKLINEESKDIIKFIAKKRGTTTKIILKTINQDQKRRINKTQQKLTKTHQKLKKTQQELIKSQKLHQKLIKSQKSQQKLIKSQRKLTKSQDLIKLQRKLTKPTKPIKTQQKPTKTQQASPKKIIETIRKKLNELRHNFPKSELKEIKNYLYNLENKNKLSETSKKYLDELDKKVLKSDKYDDDFIGIENVKDLFSILNYEPVLVRTGFNNNYLEYRSEGNNSLSFEEYLDLIRPYLNELINAHKDKSEWKL